MEPKQLRPDLQEIVNKIESLRALTEKTGFFTHRDIGDLLRTLSTDDKAAVSDALPLKPREIPNNLKRFNPQTKPNTNFNR
jgi:hypothetical protein